MLNSRVHVVKLNATYPGWFMGANHSSVYTHLTVLQL